MTQYDIGALGRDEAPFFHARQRQTGVEVTGDHQFIAGEKVPGNSPDKPDGLFVDWSWNGTRLVVRNDHYGFWPVFYSCYGSEFRISTSIEQVLRGNAPKDLDEGALAVILRMGHPIGEDTPFNARSGLATSKHADLGEWCSRDHVRR
jgi:asparagine synthase (glutamine-hydrolysing)